MADSILPWIGTYLIDMAEKYGANIHSVPLESKKKKVQLAEFLTYGVENEDSIIWARISDKSHIVPIRFSKEALVEYNKFNDKRITQHRTAIITIKDYRPFFARIPLGGNAKMSTQPFLAIECNSFSVIGSLGEAMFGNPKPVESNKSLREWSEGLKQDGGGGNILKERKVQSDQASKSTLATPRLQFQTEMSTKGPHPVQVAKKAAVKPNSPPWYRLPATTTTTTQNEDPVRVYQRSWRSAQKLPFRGPPEEVKALLSTMPVAGDPANDAPQPQMDRLPSEVSEPPHKRRRIGPSLHPLDFSTSPPQHSQGNISQSTSLGTPLSGWGSPSPARSTHHRRNSSIRPFKSNTSTPSQSVASSHVSTPTPAQRRQAVSPPPPSSLRHVTPEVVHPFIGAPRSVARKVPRPQPVPSPGLAAGPALILVPNSDTSGTASQSQSLTQSQPVALSQLSQLPRPAVEEEEGNGTDDAPDSLFDGSYDADRSSPLVQSFGTLIRQTQSEDVDVQAATTNGADKLTSVKEQPTVLDLDEDDAQVHHQLFGMQDQQNPQTRSANAKSRTSDNDEPGSKSRSSTSDLIPERAHISPRGATQPVEERQISTRSGIDIVQHNAKAWSAPSFLWSQHKINEKTAPSSKSTSHLPITSTPNGSTKPNTSNSSSADLQHQGHPTARDQIDNSGEPSKDDTSARCTSSPKDKSPLSRKAPVSHEESSLTTEAIPSTKRARDETPDADPEQSGKAPLKKSKLILQNAQPGIKLEDRSMTNSPQNSRKKLNGFSVNMDRVLLADEALPFLSWFALKSILLRTGRDRTQNR